MDLEVAKGHAERLIGQYPQLKEWKFAFDNKKRSVGTCSYNRKTIFLSKAFIPGMDANGVLDTILHEIAHALVGPGHAHDMVWRAKAIEIGCCGNVTAKDKKLPTTLERGAKWVCVCPEGKVVKTWFRKPAASTFAKLPTLYVPKRMDETLGKLRILTVDEYQRSF